eukprot:gene3268-13292_t
MDKLPVYAMGASSGGSFVLVLATFYSFKAVCAQIMGVSPDFLSNSIEQKKEKGGGGPLYPPAMFVHMARDKQISQFVARDMKVLEGQGIPVTEIQVRPAPLTESLLHDSYPREFPEDQSRAIYKAFKGEGFLDENDHLTHDPRRSDWRAVITGAKVPGHETIRLAADDSPLAEILNLLYAQHEIISDTTVDMLNWFSKQA